MSRLFATVSCGLLSLLWAAPAAAVELQITVENLQPADGFYFTPVWLGLHDGGFDLFDMGAAASSELATLAETGDVGPLGSLFSSMTNGDGTARAGTVITAPGGFAGAPVFDPGESISQTWTVDLPASNRYLSLASMVIPSNDAFFGNGNPMQYEVFGADGTFLGPLDIAIVGGSIYDAGSELNTTMGAAFSALGGTDEDEMGDVMMHPGLDNFLGTQTAAGTTLAAALNADTPLARIRVNQVPEPTSWTLALLGLPWLLRRRPRA